MSVLIPRRCSACKEVGHISRHCPYKILRSEFVFKTVIGVIKCFVDRRCVYGIIKGMVVESINLFYDQLLPLMREREERWRNSHRISFHPSTTALGKKFRIIELFSEIYNNIVYSISEEEYHQFYSSSAYNHPYVRQSIFTASCLRKIDFYLYRLNDVPPQIRSIIRSEQVIDLTNPPVQRTPPVQRQEKVLFATVCDFIPNDKECPICFELMKSKSVMNNCGHCTCVDCLVTSLKSNLSTQCCICRAPISQLRFLTVETKNHFREVMQTI